MRGFESYLYRHILNYRKGMIMNIVEMQLSELKPYDNNQRHNDVAVQPVANSIREFGFKVPIVVDADNVIIAGHTRYRAAQQLGLDTVPCIVADDLSPQQVKAFRLADNKVSEFAMWDPDAMMEELQGILEIDMSEFGFIDNTEALDEVDDTYTTDINIPQYEPSGEVVPLESCIDDVFEAMLRFLESTGAITVAFAQGGDLIGGIDNGNFKKKLLRKAMKPFQFLGRVNEDVNTYTLLGQQGVLMFTICKFMLNQKQTQSNAGGMTSTYLDNGTFVKSFYSVMYSPSCVKIAAMGDKHMRMHHRVNWDCCTPKIINERWKKSKGG